MRLPRLAVIVAALLAPLLLLATWRTVEADTYGPARPGAVATYATPAALAASPTAGLSAGAQAYVANVGTYTYTPSCPATCDGALRCLLAAGVDGGLGCWVLPVAAPACVQTTWYVGPGGSDHATGLTSGTELATLEELWRRLEPCGPLNVSVTVNVTGGPLGTLTDPPTGPAGLWYVTGTPGATQIYVSNDAGLTTYGAQSGNAQAYVYDSHVNYLDGGPAGASLVGARLRVTTTARANVVAWITAADGGQAWLSDPELEVLPPTAVPYNLTSTALVSGDNYVVETLPHVNNWAAGGWVTPDSAIQAHAVHEGISFDTAAPYGGHETGSVPCYSTQPNPIRFISCNMGDLSGCYTASSCAWGDYALDIGSGQSPWIYGGWLGGDSECEPGAYCFFGQGTVVTPSAANFSAVGVQVMGYLVSGSPGSGGLGIVAAGTVGPGLDVLTGGVVRADHALWGTGNTYGVNAEPGSLVAWSSTPTITGTSGDTYVGTLTHGFAVPWASAATGYQAQGARLLPESVALSSPNVPSEVFCTAVQLDAGLALVSSGHTLTNARVVGATLAPTADAGSAVGAQYLVAFDAGFVGVTSLSAAGTKVAESNVVNVCVAGASN